MYGVMVDRDGKKSCRGAWRRCQHTMTISSQRHSRTCWRLHRRARELQNSQSRTCPGGDHWNLISYYFGSSLKTSSISRKSNTLVSHEVSFHPMAKTIENRFGCSTNLVTPKTIGMTTADFLCPTNIPRCSRGAHDDLPGPDAIGAELRDDILFKELWWDASDPQLSGRHLEQKWLSL